MNKKFKKLLKLSLLVTMLATSCARKQTVVIDSSGLTKTSPTFIYNNVADFSLDTSLAFEASDARGNGDPFGVIWSKDNVSFDKENKVMDLKINKSGNTYYGAEVRTAGDYGAIQYGYFSTKMKPSNVRGTASTFFTYTGPSEGNPHDEIDIEFLGKDTTKVQFNYFVNDIGGHEYMYDLGFDASEEFHTYGFYWDESKIVWYVDDKPVYGISGDVPTTPQRTFANFWLGNQENKSIENWMGLINDSNLPAKASYKDFSVSYLNGYGLDVPEPEYIPSYDEFTSSPIAFNKGATDLYTATTNAEKTETRITYSQVTSKSYKNIYGAVASEVNSGEYIALKIKNNSRDDYVHARVDIQSEKPNAAGIKSINSKSWQDGDSTRTDLVYGGSYFDIEPLQESICIVKFYGQVSNVLLMLDSCSRTDKEFYAGDVTVSGFGYYGTNPYVEEWVKVNKSSLVLEPGQEEKLTIEATGEYSCTVENPNIATIASDGTVKALQDGTTTITITSGLAKTTVTVKVSSISPKEEETMPIVSDAEDLADVNKFLWSNGTAVNTTENTYGNSSTAVQVSGASAGQSTVFKISGSALAKVTSTGYISFFAKNMNHVPSGSGETKNGFNASLYNSTSKEKVGNDFKLYKSYNAEYIQDAGNDWLYYNIPVSVFADEGSTFDCLKIKYYASMSDSEVFFFDGLKTTNLAIIDTPTTPSDSPDSSSTGGNDSSSSEKKLETFSICSDSEDLISENNKQYINGTYQMSAVTTYGTSTNCLAWSQAAQYENMMLFASLDKAKVTIEENAYLEFYIKDVNHTSGTEERASGVVIRLYNGSASVKVDGVQDVKCYKAYSADYRQDAGNGWYYYKIPLSAFGTVGAEFDRIRISTNVQFDANEVMYLDGLRIVK